eukprot:PhM_4_TR12510/c0_g2_i1/m.14171
MGIASSPPLSLSSSTATIIQHDSDRNTYDYSGPVVTTAAVLSDRAFGGQILVNDQTVLHMGDSSSSWFIETANGGRDVMQYNPPGLPEREFVSSSLCGGVNNNNNNDLDDGGSGSVASALEQSKAGVTTRRATVMVIHFHAFDRPGDDADSKETFASKFQSVMACVGERAAAEKGHVHGVSGSCVVVTFNVASKATRGSFHAVRLFHGLQQQQEEICGDFTIGIFTENAVVGTLGGMHCCAGTCFEMATSLERECYKRWRSHNNNNPNPTSISKPPCCLVDGSMCDDLEALAITETIDMWTPPPSYTSKLQDNNCLKLSSLFRLLVAVHGPDESKDRNAEDEENEWMYELQQLRDAGSGTSGGAMTTAGALHAVTDAIFAQIQRMPKDGPDFSRLTEVEDVCVNELGFRRLREIMFRWEQWKEERVVDDSDVSSPRGGLSFREFLVDLFNVFNEGGSGSSWDMMMEGSMSLGDTIGGGERSRSTM